MLRRTLPAAFVSAAALLAKAASTGVLALCLPMSVTMAMRVLLALALPVTLPVALPLTLLFAMLLI